MPELQEDAWKWVGLGPPGGLQLSSGRLLIPGYHSLVWPAPNESSIGSGFTKGHTLVSDDQGKSWRIASRRFGDPYFTNEDQAAELRNGTLVVGSRVFRDQRAWSWSDDGGETFPRVRLSPEGHETYQGCEGSLVNIPRSTMAGETVDRLLYSGVQGRLPLRLYRENLTIFESLDAGLSLFGGRFVIYNVELFSLIVLPDIIHRAKNF